MSLNSENELTGSNPGLNDRIINNKTLSNGLLKKASLIRSLKTAPTIEDFALSPFNEQISNLNDGIELPSNIFELLRNRLSVDRGAFLLKEKTGQFFIPRASFDLDRTTLHRIRFSEEDVSSFFSVINKAHSIDNDFSQFKNHFSMRLFDTLETLIFLPVFSEDSLLGFFLILTTSMDIDTLLEIYNSFQTQISIKLTESRFFNIERTYASEVLSLEDIGVELDRKIEMALSKNKKLSLILFNIQNILNFLISNVPDIDPFQAGHDILSILNTMVDGIGEIKRIDQFNIILLITSKTKLNDKILLNQIRVSLMSFFEHSLNFPELTANIKKIPNDGMDSKIILSELQ